METPKVPTNLVTATAGEIIKLGRTTMRVIEDGSRTDMRFSCAELTIPPKTDGPVAHWHEMHDEGFYITQGRVRFHTLDGKFVDAAKGDFMTVPTRAPHTFSNPFDEPAAFFNTFTPAHYINYFKLLSKLIEEGPGKLTPEVNTRAMAYFATIGIAEEEMMTPEQREQWKLNKSK